MSRYLFILFEMKIYYLLNDDYRVNTTIRIIIDVIGLGERECVCVRAFVRPFTFVCVSLYQSAVHRNRLHTFSKLADIYVHKGCAREYVNVCICTCKQYVYFFSRYLFFSKCLRTRSIYPVNVFKLLEPTPDAGSLFINFRRQIKRD